MIEKTAVNKQNLYKPLYFYESARAAFEDILNKYPQSTLMLPGYIGFSPKEGSGIYDPVVNSGINHVFYPIDKNLNINIEQFGKVFSSIGGQKIVLLVHYFGYTDPHIADLVEICKTGNSVVIEDAAHGLYTDFIDHRCGQYGDFVLYSLHKMLPFEGGGMLKINNVECEFEPKKKLTVYESPFMYDLKTIADKRKRNARLWNELLGKSSEVLSIMRPYSDSVTPQTFPIIIKEYDRNDLYFKLNESGFGAVSLYHTMIEPIQNGDHDNAMWLSKHIINLPVHQDVNEDDIHEMAKQLLSILG